MSTLFETLLPLSRPLPPLAPGAALFHVGDAVDRLHLVVSGRVHLLRHAPEGAPVILQRARPGDVLAEASVWSRTHHCDAVAVTDALVHALPRRQVRALLPAPGDVAAAYLSHIAAELRRTRLRAEILALRTVAGRLDAWLAAEDGGLPPKGEWSHLAHEIAVSPEALYRELARRRAEEA